MIPEILSQLKLIETQLNNIEALNIPDHLKKEELKALNEKLDELNSRISNSDRVF